MKTHQQSAYQIGGVPPVIEPVHRLVVAVVGVVLVIAAVVGLTSTAPAPASYSRPAIESNAK